MKKIAILSLTILTLLLTNCGSNSEPPKDLLRYSVIEEDISDTPLKTQVSMKILLEDIESVTEEKLEILLNYLYDQQIVREGFEHHNHPNTILVYAYATKEKSDAGVGQWVAMISKMYDDTKPNFDISKTQFNSLTATEQDRWGLTHKQRQEIWDKIVYAERNAQNEADNKHPLDKPGITRDDMIRNGKAMEKFKIEYEDNIAKEYKIEQPIIDSIGLEGVIGGWSFPK